MGLDPIQKRGIPPVEPVELNPVRSDREPRQLEPDDIPRKSSFANREGSFAELIEQSRRERGEPPLFKEHTDSSDPRSASPIQRPMKREPDGLRIFPNLSIDRASPVEQPITEEIQPTLHSKIEELSKPLLEKVRRIWDEIRFTLS